MPNYPGAAPGNLPIKLGEEPSLFDWGCVGNGTVDDTVNFQRALTAMGNAGGGALRIPRGNFNIATSSGLSVPSKVDLWGYGPSSRVFRGTTLTAGFGLFNLNGTDITLDSFLADGMTTTPVPLAYGAISGAVDPQLTTNSTIWAQGSVAGGVLRTKLHNVQITHSGGYGVFIDARAGSIDDWLIDQCLFYQNRPHLFGLTTGTAVYGAWTGGVFYCNDGSTTTAVSNLRIQGSQWRRNDGHCFWGHSTVLGTPAGSPSGGGVAHSNINVIGNSFEDCGLDAVLIQNSINGAVSGNQFHRVGYTTQGDTDTPAPMYLATEYRYATALDSGGFVRGFNYSGNTFVSINGQCVNLDGFRDGNVSGNTCIIPESNTPQYVTDSIGSYASGGNIAGTGGFGTGNSNLNGAAQHINFLNNTFVNLGYSALALAYAKFCSVRGNVITYPTNPAGVPITLIAATGTDETACHDNTIEDNTIGVGMTTAFQNFCIAEQGTGWTASDINRVFNNRISGTNYGEFLRTSGSGGTSASVVGFQNSTNDVTQAGSPWTNSANIFQREGSNATAAWKIYKSVAGVSTQILALADTGPLLNVSAAGAANTGGITTGNITALGILHSMATQRFFSEGGYVSLHDTGTLDTSGNTLDVASQAPSAWCLFRYSKAVGVPQYSVATDASANRIWTSFGSGTGVPGGTDTTTASSGGGSIQVNKTGVGFYGDQNLIWNYTDQILTITTKPIASPGGAGLIFTDGVAAGASITYLQSNGGFYTPSVSQNAIQAPFGTVLGKFVAATGNSYNAVQAPTSQTATVGGGMAARSFTASTYLQVGTWNTSTQGTLAVTPNDTFNPGALYWELSGTPGLRVNNGAGWITLGGAGSGVAGSDTFVQYNDKGVQTADGNFTWTYGSQQLQVIGQAGLAAITVATHGYILSADGFNTGSSNVFAIQAPSGGVSAGLSVRAGQAFISAAQTSTQVNLYTIPTGFGGLAASNVASTWWYWNGTGWGSINFAQAAASSVSGSNTWIQYNNANAFGSSAGLAFSASTLLVGTAAIPVTPASTCRLSVYDNSSGSATLQFVADNTGAASQNAQLNLQAYGSSSPVLGGVVRGIAARGTLSAPSATIGGDRLMLLVGGGYTAGLAQSQASIAMYAGSNWSGGNAEAYMAFSVTPASSTVLTEAMRIASNSVLLINRTTTDGTGAQVQVNGLLSASGGLVSSVSTYNALSLSGTAGGLNVATGQFRSGQFNAVLCTAAGGMAARSFTATTYVQLGFGSYGTNGPTVTPGDTFEPGSIYFDTGFVALRVWSGSAWVAAGGSSATAGGSTGSLQYNNGSNGFTGDSNIVWSSGSRVLSIAGTAGVASIAVTGGGISTNSTSGAAFSAVSGGATLLTLTVNSTLTNSIQTSGGITTGNNSPISVSATGGGYYVGGSEVISSALNITCNNIAGNAITGASLVTTTGIQGSGYNVNGGWDGQSVTITIPGGFTVSGLSGTFHSMNVKGGVIVQGFA